MKPWPDDRRRAGGHVDPADVAAVQAEGIDLDPLTPSERLQRHVAREGHTHDAPDGSDAPDGPDTDGDGHEHPSGATPDHAHPHEHSEPGQTPLIGIVGAGAVGTALGVALTRAGWPIAAVASRDKPRRDRFRTLVSGTRGFAEATALLDEVELIILAVPDDALPAVASGLHLYSGQALVHTSGLLGAEVLAPAMAAGTQVGAFHPLVAFADMERAVAALRGATIAIEGDDQLADLLARMAEAIGGVPVRLAPGSKAAYHAAAVLAAGGIVALLDAIAELGRVAGLDEAGALAVYTPLIEQTLGNAAAIGIRAALTGPMTRGDAGTVTAHLAELAADAPDVLELYRALAKRELALVEQRGTLAPNETERLRSALANPA